MFYFFNDWKQLVESMVYFHTSIALDDLPDENYYFNYASGVPAQIMAGIVLSNNGIM